MPLWLFLCIPGYSLFYDKSKKLCNEVISLHSKKYRAGKAIKYQVVEVTQVKGYLTHQVNTSENQVTLINRYCPPLNYPKHCHKSKVPKKDYYGKHHGMNFFPGYIICY